MVAKTQQIFAVAILILVCGNNLIPQPVCAAKTTSWPPRFLKRQQSRSRSAGAHPYASSSAEHDPSVQGRSADTSTGRDLFKKFLMFKSLYQQEKPQNDVIVITQTAAPTFTTTPTTIPSTTTTTTTPTVTNPNPNPNPTTVTTTMRLLDNNNSGVGEVGQYNEEVAGAADMGNARRQQRPVIRKRQGVRKNGNFNIPPMRRKVPVGGGGGNGFGQQTNGQKVRIITKRVKNNSNNNRNRIANNNNKKKKSSINSNNNTNSNRLQNIMNAFRVQTPVVYNY